MNRRSLSAPAQALLLPLLLLCTACATKAPIAVDAEPVYVPEEAVVPNPTPEPEQTDPRMGEQGEGSSEVPLSVAESEAPIDVVGELAEAVVEAGQLERHEVIRDLVAEARVLLRDVPLEYVFTGKGKRETLRGRPVAFALWSEEDKDWTIAHVEIPRPPVNWKPRGKPMAFRMRTPGITGRHVKGTGAERLMFSFSRNGEPLMVYGRKFPVFDSKLISRKQWRAVARTAKPIVYLPFTEDTLDPLLVRDGREFLLATARRAIEELRSAEAPSVAYPGTLLADLVPAEVITTLAVIEQMDDTDFVQKGEGAYNEVLNHYGLKREEAYRYSVSSASAIGPMQFTNRRGNGTYSMVVRRCPKARIDPDFERGATNLLNAMKAAICLFDIELSQMRADIRQAYRNDARTLGIFPVAAYNGGPRNVTKLYNVLKRMKVGLDELSPPGDQADLGKVTCPCVWKKTSDGVRPVSIPRYNNENRWYIEKYQSILGAFD